MRFVPFFLLIFSCVICEAQSDSPVQFPEVYSQKVPSIETTLYKDSIVTKFDNKRVFKNVKSLIEYIKTTKAEFPKIQLFIIQTNSQLSAEYQEIIVFLNKEKIEYSSTIFR